MKEFDYFRIVFEKLIGLMKFDKIEKLKNFFCQNGDTINISSIAHSSMNEWNIKSLCVKVNSVGRFGSF